MTEFNRETVLDALQQDWGSYIQRFHSLTPEQQQQFITRQGYASLRDLLAHVINWWQDGIPNIVRFVEDPQAVQPDYDVDDFNAKAVERFSSTAEDEVCRLFEETRSQFIALVESLPEWTFSDPRFKMRLYAETIGHYSEHRFN